MKHQCLLVSAMLLACGAAFGAPVKVSIDSGTLVGDSNDGVNTFKGVPFAKAPVGNLRWAPP
ncbi:MAG TPA: carboxylesterase family protein, partial [Steroidobacteraceae bacterium]|nr:carboxylesterase family protein [Steroidobacteraceae bacterium]